MSRGVILCFDTVISGGDISLWQGEKEVGAIKGNSDSSSSETLLISISELLKKCNIEKKEVSDIAFTIGPGSYTGIRIGIATALGLSASLNCKLHGFSSLLTLAQLGVKNGSVVVGVWAGRNEIAHQEFVGSKEMEFGLLTTEEFLSKFVERENEIILDGKSVKSISEIRSNSRIRTISKSDNVARLLAALVLSAPDDSGDDRNNLTPIYSRSLFDS